MKYSIIIVAYKDYASLDRCIASIRASQIDDYEIVVVDNTEDYREDIYGDICYRDGTNYGFAKGCNIGSDMAKGDMLVFLNPDTQVFGDWADRMADGIHGDVVAVGPVSDFVAGVQKASHYRLNTPRGFVETKLLIGFCLMIRRDIFDRLDGMDEDLFLGCDDLDLSWRIGLEGLKMSVATGVFVHHEGHTSMKMNPDKDKLIAASEKAMRAKLEQHYGDDVPTSGELWGCDILPTRVVRQKLSVCMIAKEWSPELDRLLEALTFADEIVCDVVGVIDNFARASNTALSKCTGDWVLWLDSDDEVPEEAGEKIRHLMDKPGPETSFKRCHFAFQVRNTGKDGAVINTFHQSRLFPRLPGLVWAGVDGGRGVVHETYAGKASEMGMRMYKTDIVINHTGYGDEETRREKARRNLHLLEIENEGATKYYNIGVAYNVLGDSGMAEESFRRALAFSPDEEKADNLRFLIAVICMNSGRLDEVPGLLSGNRKPDSYFLAGKWAWATGNTEEAIRHFEGYLAMGRPVDTLGTYWDSFSVEARRLLDECRRTVSP